MDSKPRHTLTVLVVLAISAKALYGQLPVEIVTPEDTMARAYTVALKQAVLSSASFVLQTASAKSRRLRVTVIVGGGVTCEEGSQFRAVTLLMTAMPHVSDESERLVVAVYKVGEEEEAARSQLLHLQEAAESLGIHERRR